MIEKSFAAVVLLVCIAFMVRLLLNDRLRWKLDTAARLAWRRLRDAGLSMWRWRRSRKDAARVAEEAIRRARGDGQWDGNVFKPKSFKRPPRDKMH